MPGYTHGQRAQVVSLAHHLLAYVEMLQRDVGRLEDAHDRCDVLPLGSGALAGSTLPLDRGRRGGAELLEHQRQHLDAVADRDFVVEVAAACALTMVHLSRLAEEVVLWTSSEFGFAELPDSHATGSSLMPQKKNPDVLELVRGRSGARIADLTALLSSSRACRWPTTATCRRTRPRSSTPWTPPCRRSRWSRTWCGSCVSTGARSAPLRPTPRLLATDVAEYLVVRGMPFRAAHQLVPVRRPAHPGGGPHAGVTSPPPSGGR